MSIIHEAADEDANIIFGAVLDERMQAEMKITVIATGFDHAGSAFGDIEQTAPLRTFPTKTTAPLNHPIRNDVNTPVANDPMRPDINVPAFLRKKVD